MTVLLADTVAIDPVTLVTAGGTTGLIGYLLYTVIQFGTESWTSGKRTARLEAQVLALTQALATRSAADAELVQVLKDQTAELKAYRQAFESGALRRAPARRARRIAGAGA